MTRCSTGRLSHVSDMHDSNDSDTFEDPVIDDEKDLERNEMENPVIPKARPRRMCGPPQFFGERYFH